MFDSAAGWQGPADPEVADLEPALVNENVARLDVSVNDV